MVLSTDDTVNYIYEGKGKENDSFRLVASKSVAKAGTRSKYKVDKSKNMSGMRVKLTYTFTGSGVMAPIFVTVLGLTRREMPNHHCIAMDIEGLCVGGAGVNVGSKLSGRLMFMRGDIRQDKHRYKEYRDHVLFPFIKKVREEVYNWDSRTLIPDDLKAVSWCDGDLAQIDNIVSNESIDIYKENKAVANDQNSARLSTEQADGLARTFKTMQNIQ